MSAGNGRRLPEPPQGLADAMRDPAVRRSVTRIFYVATLAMVVFALVGAVLLPELDEAPTGTRRTLAVVAIAAAVVFVLAFAAAVRLALRYRRR